MSSELLEAGIDMFFADHPEYDAKNAEMAIYGLSWVPIPPLASGGLYVPATVNVSDSADFVITGIRSTMYPGGVMTAYTPQPPMEILFVNHSQSRNMATWQVTTDGGSAIGGQNLGYLPLSCITLANPNPLGQTHASRIWDLPYPELVKAGGQFGALLNNLQGTAANVYIALHGFHVW